MTVSYYIVYLPEGGGSRLLTIFKCVQSGATTGSTLGLLKLLRPVVYNVYCYSSEDWLEDEDQMEKVISDVEMFTTGNKQRLTLKYHKTLPSNFHSVEFTFPFFRLDVVLRESGAMKSYSSK